MRAAADNRALLDKNISGTPEQTRRHGDELTNYLVREAARAAQSQPEEVRVRAFIMALALGANDSELPPQSSTVASLLRNVEPPTQRMMRLAVLGDPTIGGRRDLLRRFLSAAFITMNSNAAAAQSAGLARELAFARGPGGFSFANVAADRAGARFAQSLIEKRWSLPMLAATFNVASYMPSDRRPARKAHRQRARRPIRQRGRSALRQAACGN